MKHEKSKNDAMRHELDHIDAKILNLVVCQRLDKGIHHAAVGEGDQISSDDGIIDLKQGKQSG